MSSHRMPPAASTLRSKLWLAMHVLRRQYLRQVWQMNIGEGSVIAADVTLDRTNPSGIHIGQYTLVESGAAILAHDFVNNRDGSVYIGNNCSIGPCCMILPGVTIGDNCIVSAGSIVVTNLPSGCRVVGNPARIVERNIETGHYGRRVQPDARSKL
jgi:acetyltransferase-like isoleucine patch superfamily enzyme